MEKNKDVVQRVLSSIVDEYRHIILDQVSVTSLSLSPHHLIGQKNFDSHSYSKRMYQINFSGNTEGLGIKSQKTVDEKKL